MHASKRRHGAEPPLKLRCFLAAAACDAAALEACLESEAARRLRAEHPTLFHDDILCQTYLVTVGTSKSAAPECMRVLVARGVDPMLNGAAYMWGLLTSDFPDHQPIARELRAMLGLGLGQPPQ